MIDKADLEYPPNGAFDLANHVQYFGDSLTLQKRPEAIAMAYPLECWKGSAFVTLWH